MKSVKLRALSATGRARFRARLRAAGAARKGGTPGEGPPFDPLLRFFAMGDPARCGARPGAPPLDPARFFVKKRGKKLLFGEAGLALGA